MEQYFTDLEGTNDNRAALLSLYVIMPSPFPFSLTHLPSLHPPLPLVFFFGKYFVVPLNSEVGETEVDRQKMEESDVFASQTW